jgi:nitrite reductase/ring-hydroxylating ferredoxin subunit
MPQCVTVATTDDTCPPRGGALSRGAVAGERVTGPRHGAVFRLTSGAVLKPPAQAAVARYTVRGSGTPVEVAI